MNHTPAPWKNRPGTLQVRCADDKLVANALCGTMRRFTTTPPERPRAEAEANARLIAAAPALLNALADALETLDTLVAHGVPVSTSGRQAMQSWRAVIAQAIGE